MVSCQTNRQLKNLKSWPTKEWLMVIAGAVCMACVGLNLWQAYANSILQLTGLTLFAITLQKKPAKALSLSFLFVTTWLAVSVWWLYIALHDVGGMPAVIAVTAIFVLCGGLGLYYVIALQVFVYAQHAVNPVFKHLLFASCWTVAELARAQWFTGFPWSAIGYSHVNSTLSYAAPWLGVYGIGFIAACTASWLAKQLLVKEKNNSDQLKIVIVLLIFCVPAYRQEDTQGPVLSVNLLQANISQTEKYNTGRQQALDWYAEKTQESKADLTVLPEIAIPYFKEELPQGYWGKLTHTFREQEQIAVIGIPTLDKDKGYGNSAIGLGFGEEKQYDKYHLVPFGEFTPEILKWFSRLMVNNLGDFNRGSINQTPFIWQAHKLSMTICYEDLFGEDLAVRFVKTDQVPTLFINISNIAWFGDTMVVNQHLDIARMRSLEFERPTVRATNSGGTAIISAQAKVVNRLPEFIRGNLQGEVISKDRPITAFAYWAGHWGLLPVWMTCLLVMGLAIIYRIRSDKHKSTL